MTCDPFPTAATLAEAIGRKRIAEALGVGPTAVSNHVVRGKFPPAWLSVMMTLAAEAGVSCPEHLFRMRRPIPTPQNQKAG